MIQEKAHLRIVENCDQLDKWFIKKKQSLAFPVYASIDIRDSGFKVVSVDTNIFPAGFNNICDVDRENGPPIFKKYLQDHYEKEISKVLLITEEHTNNPYYWENIWALSEIIQGSGVQLKVSLPKNLSESFVASTSTGREIKVSATKLSSNGLILVDDDFVPDLIISNNDFSISYQDWAENLKVPINPPRGLGWYQRKKSTHFQYYNELVSEFADVIGLNPWHFQVDTEVFTDFNPNNEISKKALATKLEGLFLRTRRAYEDFGVDTTPTAFIKNNAGTYGLAVTKVDSPEEILTWNNRTRTKMKASKGGRDVEEIIIQEGVASRISSDGASAEPVIYLMGCDLLGGFLRTHKSKGPNESLNSPGAVYKRLCVTDLQTQIAKCPLENVYGWIARISCLATGLEAQSMGVDFEGYRL